MSSADTPIPCTSSISGGSRALSLADVPFVKHHTHYYSDGSFIFIFENTILFRIYQDVLTRRSDFFANLFNFGSTSSDQLYIDGVPAIHIPDDTAEAFGHLMDMIIPGPVNSREEPIDFKVIADIYRLSDKYGVEDVREMTRNTFVRALFHTEPHITRIRKGRFNPAEHAQVIKFILGMPGHDLEVYLPLSMYIIAMYKWDEDGPRDKLLYQEMLSLLPPAVLLKIATGKERIHAFAVDKVFAEDFPPAQLCKKCTTSNSETMTEFSMEFLGRPLEELDRMAKEAPRTLCNRCSAEFGPGAAMMRNELFESLKSFFGLEPPGA